MSERDGVEIRVKTLFPFKCKRYQISKQRTFIPHGHLLHIHLFSFPNVQSGARFDTMNKPLARKKIYFHLGIIAILQIK